MRPYVGRCMSSVHPTRQHDTLTDHLLYSRQRALSQAPGITSVNTSGHSRGPIYHPRVVEENTVAQRR